MLSHLLELRRRALQCLGIFSAWFALFFFFAPNLFHLVVSPLLKVLPAQNGIIATQITSTVLTPLKLAADAALLCTAPFVLLHAWRFVSPGLYRSERERFRWGLGGSLVLFGLGVIFCFYVVLPFMLQFFARAIPEGVRLMPDMIYTVDFITRMLLIFGLCFQVPLVCLVLIRLQIITVDTLKEIRPYIIVSAFILGMLLTPPDVFSQVMVAIPLCILYEMGIVLGTWFGPSRGT